MSVRRYMVIVQDEKGYPPPGELEPAPPEGPKLPTWHSAVLEVDFMRVEAERDHYRQALEQIAEGRRKPKHLARTTLTEVHKILCALIHCAIMYT